MRNPGVKLLTSELLVAAILLIFKCNGIMDISWLWVCSPFWVTGIEGTIMMLLTSVFGEDAK